MKNEGIASMGEIEKSGKKAPDILTAVKAHKLAIFMLLN